MSNLVSVSKNWDQLVQTFFNPLSSPFFCHEYCFTFGSSSINLHAFQPWSYSCLQSIPALPSPQQHFTHRTRSCPHDAMLCMPSLCHLFVDCWHVVCFCFSFQFFHAQHYTEEVLCIPCQFQYVLPAHSCLAFILYLASLLFLLIFLLMLSPCWTGSGCFELRHFLRFARGLPPCATCLHP